MSLAGLFTVLVLFLYGLTVKFASSYTLFLVLSTLPLKISHVKINKAISRFSSSLKNLEHVMYC